MWGAHVSPGPTDGVRTLAKALADPTEPLRAEPGECSPKNIWGIQRELRSWRLSATSRSPRRPGSPPWRPSALSRESRAGGESIIFQRVLLSVSFALRCTNLALPMSERSTLLSCKPLPCNAASESGVLPKLIFGRARVSRFCPDGIDVVADLVNGGTRCEHW